MPDIVVAAPSIYQLEKSPVDILQHGRRAGMERFEPVSVGSRYLSHHFH